MVQLWQLESTSNWQVSIRLLYNSVFTINYAFEPMTPNPSDGEAQMKHIVMSVGQTVSQGDTIGYLLKAGNGAHVDFGLFKDNEPVCPEPYFTPEAKSSILALIRETWSGAEMCY